MATMEWGLMVDDSGAKMALEDLDDNLLDVQETAEDTGKKITKSFKKASVGMKALGKASKKTFNTMTKGAKKAGKATLNLAKAIGKAGLAGAVAGAGVSILSFKKILDDGRMLQNMSINTGIAIDKLEEFRVMTKLMGGDITDTADAVQDFTEKMGEARDNAKSSWADAFRNIGVTLTKEVTPAIEDTLRALAKMVDEGKKSEAFFVGVDLFGDAFKRTFADMISGGIEPFEEKLKEVAELKTFTHKFTGQLKKLSILFQSSILKMQKWFSGILEGGGLDVIGGTLEWVSGLFGKTGDDIQESGKKVGSFVKTYIVDKVLPKIKEIGTSVIEMFGSIRKGVSTLKGLFTPIEIEGKRVIPFVQMFGTEIEKIFIKVNQSIKIMMGEMFLGLSGLPLGMGKAFKSAGNEMLKSVDDITPQIQDKFKKVLDIVGDDIPLDDFFKLNDIINVVAHSNDMPTLNQKTKLFVQTLMNVTDETEEFKGVFGGLWADMYSSTQPAIDSLSILDIAVMSLTNTTEDHEKITNQTSTTVDKLKKSIDELKKSINEYSSDVEEAPSLDGMFDPEVLKQMGERATGLGKKIRENIKKGMDYQGKGDLISGAVGLDTDLDLGEIFNLTAPTEDEMKQGRKAYRALGRDETIEAIFGSTPQEVVSTSLQFGQQLIGTTGDILSSVFQKRNEARQREIEAQKKARDEEINGMQISDRRKQKLLKKSQQEAEKLRKKAFEKKKKQDIANTILNTASGIAGAWAGALQVQPLPAGIALGATTSALMTAVGIAQLSAIKSQEYYANGGIVGGMGRGATMGADNKTVGVRDGEMILNARQQRKLFNTINEGTGGGASSTVIHAGDIIIEGNATDDTIDQIRQIKDEQTMELRNTIYDLFQNNELDFLGV